MAAGKHIRTTASMLTAAILPAVLAGCQANLAVGTQDLGKGLIIVLPGIDGRSPHNEQMCKTLAQSGVGMSVELYDWTIPMGSLLNQTARERNHMQAQQLSQHIAAYRDAHPGCPVILIGHSGGTAIAVWAAQELPENQDVEGIILLASSLSPDYDLTAALKRTRRGIVNFYSPKDSALLGAGTTVLGTMDGRNCESAGKVRFHRNDSQQYDRLVEIGWQPEMAPSGHDGGHFGYTAGGFVSQYIAPMIKTADWQSGLASAATPPATQLATLP